MRRFLSYCLTMVRVVDTPSARSGPTSRAEGRVLDAAKRCCERWGIAKVTIDDIAAEAGVSRATLYRLFPGGKDVLFEALRVRELEEFFTELERPRRRGRLARGPAGAQRRATPPASCAPTSTSR